MRPPYDRLDSSEIENLGDEGDKIPRIFLPASKRKRYSDNLNLFIPYCSSQFSEVYKKHVLKDFVETSCNIIFIEIEIIWKLSRNYLLKNGIKSEIILPLIFCFRTLEGTDDGHYIYSTKQQFYVSAHSVITERSDVLGGVTEDSEVIRDVTEESDVLGDVTEKSEVLGDVTEESGGGGVDDVTERSEFLILKSEVFSTPIAKSTQAAVNDKLIINQIVDRNNQRSEFLTNKSEMEGISTQAEGPASNKLHKCQVCPAVFR